MRKAVVLAVAVGFLMSAAVISFAVESEEAKGSMKHHGDEQKGSKKCHMMMKKMMQGQVVAAEKGAVVVLFGNKLMKYDRDLNLVKEVEIDTGMGEMMKKCRMGMDSE